MKHVGLFGAFIVALAAFGTSARVAAQTTDHGMSLGTVHLPTRVMADGMPLDPGTYQIRLTTDHPQAAVGESPDSEQYVEFVKGGRVVGREVATVVLKSDITAVAKGEKPPAPGGIRVQMLKGNDYLRVWVNKGGTNYLLHLPLRT